MSNLVCPLDFRYGRKKIKKIFSEESKLSRLLQVEAALAEAHAEVGNLPREAAEIIKNNATTKQVKLQRVKEIEAEINHDIMAVVKAFAEVCGESGKYIHLGATSYDIIDSANAIQIKEALDIINEGLKELKNVLLHHADRYKHTVMLGRTHGQQAAPITFGLKMAVFASEINRQIKRLCICKENISVGKMSGAVGTGAALGGNFPKIQEITMKKLGLKEEKGATQIVGRDRYIELLSFLANVATTLEKFATEVRNLQRNEIGEIAEAFGKKQVGSSTMPHKKNPITSEQICGLARLVRSNLLPIWENAIQWHERDLCNSSPERFILPHSLILTDWIVTKTKEVFSNLMVYPEKMLKNIEKTSGIPMAESVMMALTRKGMDRQKAHELIRNLSMDAIEKNMHLKEIVLENSKVTEIMSNEEIHKAFDAKNYIGHAIEIVEKILEER